MSVKQDKDKVAGQTTTATTRSSRENARWIVGLLIAVIGVFTTLAVLSYIFNWKHDYSIIHDAAANANNPRADKSVDNMCGSAGAWLGDLIVGHGFGVFGLILPILTMLLGIRIISKHPRLLHRWALSSLLVMILGSLSLALGEIAFEVEMLIFGGGLGGELGRSVAIPLAQLSERQVLR